jgi:hypothetical protein
MPRNSKAVAPEQHDEGAEALAVRVVADYAHDGDDLFDRRRVGRVLLALVARWAVSVPCPSAPRRLDITLLP